MNQNEEGDFTVGFFNTTKDGAGVDVDGSITLFAVGGDVSDFEGEATIAEFEAPGLTSVATRVKVTFEGGMTQT